MSMLADILSKVQQPGAKREVAPNLKNIVNASAGKSANQKKIIILSVIFIVSLLSGLFFVQYVKSISDTPVIKAPMSAGTMRQNIREEEAAASGSSGPLQSSGPAELGKQKEVPERVQPVISGGVPGDTIQDDEALLPKVISENEAIEEVSRHLSDKPAGPAPGSGPYQNAGMHDAAEIPNKPVNQTNTDNPPSPALQAESANTHGVDAYLYGAREYEMRGDYSKALANYKKALKMDGGNSAVMNNIAYIYLRLNLIEESITYSRMAVDINRDNPTALINLGIAYAKGGDMTSAQKYLENAFRLEPDNQKVVLNLAVLHERQGRLEEASGYFSRLVKSGDMDGALGMARVYEKLGRIDGAINLYRSVYGHPSADEKMKSYARQKIIGLNNRRQE